ncbi:MAG: glycerol-3-phosphate dehydrogenase/oxidase [Kiritimatiellae bacterium]|nr:glycerol-3-phosphate dehydrogenase/oxidase [Kiritimatiellia bacterium]
MKRELRRLADETFEVLIIGGGVYGLATAWTCSLRGLRTALVERGDFGGATSAGSLKLVHGGLRYLQHLDFRRMRLSIRERRHMLRMAPHLVHPLAFLIPCYGHGVRGPEAMRAALLVNDLIAADRNRGIDDATRWIPPGRMVTAEECRKRLPGVREAGLTGGALFWDAQMYDSERLTLAFALSAAGEGAVLANYAEVVGFELAPDGAIRAARVRDILGGAEFAVRARVFINMTGPWSDITVARLRGREPGRRVRRSKGIQLIVRPLQCATAFGVESLRERDKTAKIPRGHRSYFATPWRGLTIIGTTDTLFEGDPDDYRVTEADIEGFLGAFNEAYPGAGLTRADVRFWCGGLRPLGDVDADPDHVQASNRPEFVDHGRAGGPPNLLTVVGVKYTVARALAERASRWAAERLGRRDEREPSATKVLAGGDLGCSVDEFLRRLARDHGWAPALAERMGRMYGRAAGAIAELAERERTLAGGLAGAPHVLRAEVAYACREEAAQTLADIVLRRTGLGGAGHPGAEALEECAAIAAAELGWDESRRRAELEAIEQVYRPGRTMDGGGSR